MKNTNKNTSKVIRRTAGLALSALMLTSVVGATFCSATAQTATMDEATRPAQTATMDEVTSSKANMGSGFGKISRIDVLRNHDGRVYAPGSNNWFAVKNNADGKQTYVTASGEDGITTIDVIRNVNGESEIIASETADLAETEMMKVAIPMNEEDGFYYFVNVYQNSETASTGNFSVNHLTQGYIDMLEATVLPFGETVTEVTETIKAVCSTGEEFTFNQIIDTFYTCAGVGRNYTFDVSASGDLEYSFYVTDFDGNIVADGNGFAKNGYVQEHSLDLDEHGCYFIHFFGNMDEAGEATFTFGTK